MVSSDGESRRCLSRRTVSGEPCRNRIRRGAPSKYCNLHRFCGRRGPIWGRLAERRDELEAQQRAVVTVTRPEAWRKRVSQRGRNVVDQALWKRFTAAPAEQICKTLAAVAKHVGKVDKLTKTELAERILGSDGESAEVARQVAAAVGVAVLGRVGDLRQVVVSLRVLGVFVCVGADRVPQCACWRAMVAEWGLQQAKEDLKQGLPDLLA